MLVNQILLALISINISQLKNYTKAYLAWGLTSFLPPQPSPAENEGYSAVQSTSPVQWDQLRAGYRSAVNSQQSLKASSVHLRRLTPAGHQLSWDDWINCFLDSFFNSPTEDFHSWLYHDMFLKPWHFQPIIPAQSEKRTHLCYSKSRAHK